MKGKEHQGILMDICIELKNCADCHNDEAGKIDCCPAQRLSQELHNVISDSFATEPFDERTNEKLTEIAKKHGYVMETISSGSEGEMLTFHKEKKG